MSRPFSSNNAVVEGFGGFSAVWGESQAVSDGVVGVLGAFCCAEGAWFGYLGALKPTVGVTVGAAEGLLC